MKIPHLLLASSIVALAPISSGAPGASGSQHERKDIIDTAVEAGSFETLAAALKAADLVAPLRGDGPFTVFAPNDEAFAKLPEKTLEALLRPENREQLVSVLTYHVVPGAVPASEAASLQKAKTLQNGSLRFSIEAGRLRVNESNVVANDIEASNGLIHVVDSVLLPPEGLKLAPRGRLVIGVYDERPGQALAEQLGIDRDRTLLVTRVVEGGTAAAAGLRRYDIITSISGQPASDARLKEAKAEAGFGGTIHVELLRRGKAMTLDIEVGAERH